MLENVREAFLGKVELLGLTVNRILLVPAVSLVLFKNSHEVAFAYISIFQGTFEDTIIESVPPVDLMLLINLSKLI